MWDRFAHEEIELAIEERTGCKFIICAQQIYFKLKELNTRKFKIDNDIKTLFTAIDDLIRSYNAYEANREKFVVPTVIHDDYLRAYRRYQSLKKNPGNYYLVEAEKRKNLETEKDKLIVKIKKHELLLAHGEDKIRNVAADKRKALADELAGLESRRKKYLTPESGGGKNYFLIQQSRNPDALASLDARIAKLREEIINPPKSRDSDLEDIANRLSAMHTRRWEIDEELLALEDTPALRMTRWQAAVDRAEVENNLRRYDIEDALNSHYSSYTQQPIHAFLNVYAWIHECAKKIGDKASVIKTELEDLENLANLIYCPEIANRSVETLYSKVKDMSESERMKIIAKKPAMKHLPEELLRTFAVSNLRDSTDLIKMFKEHFPENPLASIAYNKFKQ